MCVLSVSGEQVAAARQLLPEYHVCTTNEMQNLARSTAIYYSILLAITFAKEIHVCIFRFVCSSMCACLFKMFWTYFHENVGTDRLRNNILGVMDPDIDPAIFLFADL